MRLNTLATIVLLVFVVLFGAGAQQAPLPEEPGVYAETDAGMLPLKKPFSGFEISGPASSGGRTHAFVFPIPNVDGVPVAAEVTAFFVNLATVQDNAAAAAQMRFMIGDHVREPDYQVMAVRPGKFRTGIYRITSPNLTNEWMAAAYAKLTASRKWRDKRPPALIGLILNEQTMYPVQIDVGVLKEKR
jgi:hypothetical protein